MIVKVVHTESKDWFQRELLLINEKVAMSVADLSECPEDAIIGRALNSMGEVASLLKLAYDAGKRGEPFKYEYLEVDCEDYESYM